MERQGLMPAIVQDAGTGRVLMLAWMDEEALARTRETGVAWFWSRSRERLWKKGETSGNTLVVEELRDDCDGDAILLRVRPAGPTCHTGAVSCFAPWLWRRIKERETERPPDSYVVNCSTTPRRPRARSARRGWRRRWPVRASPTSASSRSSPTSGSTRTSSLPPADSTSPRSRTSSGGACGPKLPP